MGFEFHFMLTLIHVDVRSLSLVSNMLEYANMSHNVKISYSDPSLFRTAKDPS